MILLALALAACGGSAATEAEVVPSPSSVAIASQDSASQASASQTVTPAPSTTTAQVSGGAVPAGCTVVSPRPTAGPTEQSLFPPISDKDWVIGPSSASVTLLEYSDFQ